MFDWIAQTVEFFKDHPEWQLIIKPPLGEENKQIPATRQTVKSELLRMNVMLPDNVILLDAKTEATVYNLFSSIHLGLVYTTTVGLEMACLGIPVVTAGKSLYHGKGFTFDSIDQKTYFKQLTELFNMKGKFPQQGEWIKMSKMFFHLYHFIYPIDLGFLNMGQPKQMPK
jgi:hypothetical protein